MLTIMSVQSKVTYGTVGNSAVEFPLQVLGNRVLPLYTVLFSNSTIYGEWAGPVITPEDIRKIFLGVKKRGILSQCNALLTGYMGSADLGKEMLFMLEELQQANPSLIFCCDPVMGDDYPKPARNFFVKNEICEFFRDQLIKKATIITPNRFELEFLSDTKITDIESAVRAARKLITGTLKIVLLTSLVLPEDNDKHINMLVIDATEAYLIKTPLISLPNVVNGAGDLTAALFLSFYLSGKNIKFALEQSAARVYAILKLTSEKSACEMLLIEGKSLLEKPQEFFSAVQLSVYDNLRTVDSSKSYNFFQPALTIRVPEPITEPADPSSLPPETVSPASELPSKNAKINFTKFDVTEPKQTEPDKENKSTPAL